VSVMPNPETAESDARIASAQSVLHSIARKIHRAVGPDLSYDDLLAYGQVGLAQSARSFDPSRGASFTTYAYLRIRGAIYEGISQMRSGERLRNPNLIASRTAAEVLADDGDSSDSSSSDAEWLVRKTESLAVVHLLGQSASGEAGIEDRQQHAPDALAERNEAIREVRRAIERLPALEQDAIRKIYWEGWTLTQFAARHGKNKSWATRLHQKIVDLLGESLADLR